MSDIPFLVDIEHELNIGSKPLFILGLPMQKGMIGTRNQYKFVVNSNDHTPPHIHISLNNQQIAKYNLLTGERIESRLPNLDKIFADWFSVSENRQRAKTEWERFHGAIS